MSLAEVVTNLVMVIMLSQFFIKLFRKYLVTSKSTEKDRFRKLHKKHNRHLTKSKLYRKPKTVVVK